MLATELPPISTNRYEQRNASIQEKLEAIDSYTWHVAAELKEMRDSGDYAHGGFTKFEDYCESGLCKWGGYRRVKQLLIAKQVADALKDTELDGAIARESHARPLGRLIKFPDKLQQAVAIARQSSSSPTSADFAKAAQKILPKHISQKNKSVKEQLFPEGIKVKVSSQSHPRFDQEGMIAAGAPNNWQQIVSFDDGGRELISNNDLVAITAPKERTYPPQYQEAIAQLQSSHKQELERLEQEIRIRIQTGAESAATRKVAEQLEMHSRIASQLKQQNIHLQQKLDEMENLRSLEIENQQLQQRVQELEKALLNRPGQEWSNTFTKQAEKVLNQEVKKSLLMAEGRELIQDAPLLLCSGVPAPLFAPYDLHHLAKSPPENAHECLRLMGMALGVLATSTNNIQALSSAAILLGVNPTFEAIALRIEEEQMLMKAITDIRTVLASDCAWNDFWAVAKEYEAVKKKYWRSLTKDEQALIKNLRETALEIGEQRGERKITEHLPSTGNFQAGSRVSHADPYNTLFQVKGTVTGFENDMALVHWDGCEKPLFQHRYEVGELRCLEKLKPC
ncbi:hypothetical protein [aff. Roholtiella sp. LEGE 12411]|uniref:hypothetical protein n=1 Tax=aff. Roholtiella sp. LEGE 12411 TaxID=1828822 RepID=UPI00187E88D8|nr:hypothetical protein [aff. Roholtiella sp. LEGE 12411]MBE9037654.1 hypothetical protein [aff. Roholtiella sp. LEGE 12411]